jgi:hypothetical protein
MASPFAEDQPMHLHKSRHLAIALAIALLVLSTLVATLFAGVVAWGVQLTATIAIGALLVSGLLFGAMAFLHDALRAARWDAGHRLHR